MPARKLSVVEVALGVSLAGCVVMSTAPVFLQNLSASRLSEPMERLTEIASRATARAAGEPVETAYPAPVPLTPSAVPRGELVEDPPGTWDHATWRLLGFRLETPHAYSYALDSKNAPERSTFTATARGDLDGDGSLSTFLISGDSVRGGTPKVGPLSMHREVE